MRCPLVQIDLLFYCTWQHPAPVCFFSFLVSKHHPFPLLFTLHLVYSPVDTEQETHCLQTAQVNIGCYHFGEGPLIYSPTVDLFMM